MLVRLDNASRARAVDRSSHPASLCFGDLFLADAEQRAHRSERRLPPDPWASAGLVVTGWPRTNLTTRCRTGRRRRSIGSSPEPPASRPGTARYETPSLGQTQANVGRMSRFPARDRRARCGAVATASWPARNLNDWGLADALIPFPLHRHRPGRWALGAASWGRSLALPARIRVHSRIVGMALNDIPPDAADEAGRGRRTVPLTVSSAVQRAKQADEVGWNWLFDRFYPVVYRYATARLGDRHAAEDVAQDVFVAAVKMIPRLRGQDEPVVEAWFLKIARFKVVDRYRRQTREPVDQGANAIAAAAQPGSDPAEVATDRVSTARLHAMLSTLSENQRDVLVRRFVLDQSLEHIARASGRRVGAVKALQHRGLAALQRQVAGHRDD